MTNPTGSSTGNWLLDSLTSETLERLQPLLTRIDLKPGQTLWQRDDPLREVYFPTGGIVSVAMALDRGAANIEVASVGKDGLIGASAVLGAETAVSSAVVQLAGSALQIAARELRDQASRDPDLSARLLRHVRARYANIAYSAACNARHKVEERLARWLLTAGDLIGDSAIAVSHARTATLLGVRRAGVTSALNGFKNAGLLRLESGRIVILDRAGLEAASCACYFAVKAEYEALKNRP